MRFSHALLSASTSTTSAQRGEGSIYEFRGGIHLSNFTAAERALNAITYTNFFFYAKMNKTGLCFQKKEFFSIYFLDRHLQRYKNTGAEA